MTELAPFFAADKYKFHEQPGKSSAADQAAAQGFMNLGMVLRKCIIPMTGQVTNISTKGGKTVVSIKATQVCPEAGLDLSKPAKSIVGKLTLIFEANEWRIYDEYWKSKNGGLEQALGTDPDAPKKSSSDTYRDAIVSEVNRFWKAPSTGEGRVGIEYRNSTKGGAQLLAIVDKKNSSGSVDAIRNEFAGFILPPLPADMKSTPIVGIDLNWVDGRSGCSITHNSFPLLVQEKNAREITQKASGDWLEAAVTEPYKKAIAAGPVYGTQVTFRGSELKPLPSGNYTLELFQPLGGEQVVKVRVYLDARGPFDGKTIKPRIQLVANIRTQCGMTR